MHIVSGSTSRLRLNEDVLVRGHRFDQHGIEMVVVVVVVMVSAVPGRRVSQIDAVNNRGLMIVVVVGAVVASVTPTLQCGQLMLLLPALASLLLLWYN